MPQQCNINKCSTNKNCCGGKRMKLKTAKMSFYFFSLECVFCADTRQSNVRIHSILSLSFFTTWTTKKWIQSKHKRQHQPLFINWFWLKKKYVWKNWRLSFFGFTSNINVHTPQYTSHTYTYMWWYKFQ